MKYLREDVLAARGFGGLKELEAETLEA